MQAMSLVVTDSDGEQNEMRNLQDRLSATMTVVTQLTGQLAELKEQVILTYCTYTSKNKNYIYEYYVQ